LSAVSDMTEGALFQSELISMQLRCARERAYWDEAYQPTGPDHAKYLWTKHIERISFIGECFYRLAGRMRDMRILSLGGGIDRLGIFLAQVGNRVVTVDISPIASAATHALAAEAGVLDNVVSVAAAAEDVDMEDQSFDVVIFKRALHHMDLPTTIGHVYRLLVSGGLLLAEEPVCLPAWLSRVHKECPFHPYGVRTADERELTPGDLTFIRRMFSEVSVSYFDCLARESIAYFLYKARVDRLLRPLGHLDYLLMNRYLPMARYLSTYAIIRAVK
jgi:protein-L-isoaspartate O-methyltransferase